MNTLKDISGQQFYQLKVIRITDKRSKDNRYPLWECLCSCGNTCYATGVKLRKGSVKSCGCRPTKIAEDLTGRKFAMLTVIGLNKIGKYGHYRYNCMCDCGKAVIRERQDLVNGKTKSCGCNKRKGRWRGCGQLSGSLWKNIVHNANRRGYAVEITITDAWNLFIKQDGKCALSGVPINFKARYGEVGENTNTASLDRIDSSKPYTLDNIQWVHKHINNMKQSLSDTDFIGWCRRVVCHQN